MITFSVCTDAINRQCGVLLQFFDMPMTAAACHGVEINNYPKFSTVTYIPPYWMFLTGVYAIFLSGNFEVFASVCVLLDSNNIYQGFEWTKIIGNFFTVTE